MADPTDTTNPPAGAPIKRGAPRRARKKKTTTDTRRQKEFTYRGRTLEELLALPHDEVMALLPSRARRFMKRMNESQEHEATTFYQKVQEAGEGGSVRTHLRDFPILPVFVGKTIEVHTGKEFQKVGIVAEMIGHKLGEFAGTRKSVKHTGPGVGATRSSKFMPLK
ncbi:MAG TPA: 30S ribosomal protein S19 [Candidatus Thermoplasmatota archaeon]|nr:30S ribosomal protein S19 [Candidatus Thermoplasmatota archaeon]